MAGMMGAGAAGGPDTPLFRPNQGTTTGSAASAYIRGDASQEPFYILPVPPDEECLILLLQRCCEMDYIDRDA